MILSGAKEIFNWNRGVSFLDIQPVFLETYNTAIYDAASHKQLCVGDDSLLYVEGAS